MPATLTTRSISTSLTTTAQSSGAEPPVSASAPTTGSGRRCWFIPSGRSARSRFTCCSADTPVRRSSAIPNCTRSKGRRMGPCSTACTSFPPALHTRKASSFATSLPARISCGCPTCAGSSAQGRNDPGGRCDLLDVTVRETSGKDRALTLCTPFRFHPQACAGSTTSVKAGRLSPAASTFMPPRSGPVPADGSRPFPWAHCAARRQGAGSGPRHGPPRFLPDWL